MGTVDYYIGTVQFNESEASLCDEAFARVHRYTGEVMHEAVSRILLEWARIEREKHYLIRCYQCETPLSTRSISMGQVTEAYCPKCGTVRSRIRLPYTTPHETRKGEVT